MWNILVFVYYLRPLLQNILNKFYTHWSAPPKYIYIQDYTSIKDEALKAVLQSRTLFHSAQFHTGLIFQTAQTPVIPLHLKQTTAKQPPQHLDPALQCPK